MLSQAHDGLLIIITDAADYSLILNCLCLSCSFFRADTLFELWNKYEPRLPKIYYQEKLLEMGDFLMSIEVCSFFSMQQTS